MNLNIFITLFFMSFYLFLYIFVAIIFLYIGVLGLTKYKNVGIYFFFSFFLFSIWIILYFISFSILPDKEILLYISRLLYSLTIPASYSLLLFVFFFNKKEEHNKKIFFLLFFLIIMLSVFTNYVINDLTYDSKIRLFYENYGILYPLYIFLYFLFLPLFIIIGRMKIVKLKFLDQIRLKYIYFGFIFYLITTLIILVLLPVLGIWIMQKEIILFFLPLLFSVLYSSHRYNFTNIKFLFSRIINFCISFLLSSLILSSLKLYFLNFDVKSAYFWDIDDKFGISDLFLGLSLFLIFYNLFKKYIFGNNEYTFLLKEFGKLRNKMIHISNLYSLNKFLNKEFVRITKAKFAKITLKNHNNSLFGLESYFMKDKSNNLFINDVVFIEENKHKFDYETIKNEISDLSYLIFPLIDNKGVFIGIFEIGIKDFGDIYSTEEINIFRDFINILFVQLKHIEIYENIYDLNLNLDKKVDEKTIEYNSLLNKQSDFISLISHEIKSPLGSCIFQLDSIIDDFKEDNFDKKYILDELSILSNQLENVGNLTKTMFSIKKYDLNKVELFRQKLDLNLFLDEKISLYKKQYPYINFILDVRLDITYFMIDKIQFSQVIDNLLINAIKFSNKDNPKVSLKSFIEKDNIILEIEDNGEGLNQMDAKNIFEKYVTGEGSSVGIGMGMYLCKRIVELHGGFIEANNSDLLGGARFIITMPVIID